jgi:branched-chain amino acid transport system substrate-binding protein
MKCTIPIYRFLFATLCFLLIAGNALSATIVLGQVAELSGQATTTESMQAAQLWFDAASKNGPHKYVLKSMDDGRDPKITVSLTKQLIAKEGVQALFGYRSTPSLELLSKDLSSLKVPLVAPFNGAQSVRKAAGDWGFFLRANYHDEAKKLVTHLATVGVSRIAIVHQQDAFGADGLAGYLIALASNNLKASKVLSYDRKTLDITSVIDGLKASQPTAVLMACSAKACAEIIKNIRTTDRQMMFLSMSNMVTDEFLRDVAFVGRNVLLSQVMPYPWDLRVPVVKEFNRLNNAAGNKVPVSYSAIEGFISAKLMTEAVNRAGKRPTAESIQKALVSMKGVDLGGVIFDSSRPANLVELTLVTSGGRLIR